MNGGKPASNVNPHVVSLQLLFAAWITHFKSLGYIKDTTLEHLDKNICKKTLQLTVKDGKTREAIGMSRKVWSDLVEVFAAAVPSFETRTFDASPPPSPEFDGPSSAMIVTHSATLLADLQRLDHMLAIARNVLTAGEAVQNNAAQSGFDREVCSLINLCIKITARGFDGDASAKDEDKWQGVINGFKKLLITSLQFLSNLITMNERLKLMLWVELFDTSLDANDGSLPPVPSSLHTEIKAASSWVLNATKAFLNRTADTSGSDSTIVKSGDNTERPVPALPAFLGWLKANRESIREDVAKRGMVDSRLIAMEANRRWAALSDEERAPWIEKHAELMVKFRNELEAWQASGENDPQSLPEAASEYLEQLTISDPSNSLEDGNPLLQGKAPPLRTIEFTNTPPTGATAITTIPETSDDSDLKMLETAADGARKLQVGKEQLLKRLESYPSEHNSDAAAATSPTSPMFSPRSPTHDDLEGGSEVEEEEESIGDEESSDNDDYARPGEDGRGLLTDIPLILGPNEIEVLPMIIMSGIVASPATTGIDANGNGDPKDAGAMLNMHTIRCHLLLAQENGRNLLRELLIFVAAWDLREEELYFKFMVKIMEAILTNGLMPFAYGAFKESKDIISPAQAVIMKLLTKIFHSRQGTALARGSMSVASSPSASPSATSYPQKVDIKIVHCLLNEFRQNIIPQICALIFLQGQIRVGMAGTEDFPLNLWDMERMYEGVYQYLEFFAILTDHEVWKQMMADWEITSELITLLRELDFAIPKDRLVGALGAQGVDNKGKGKQGSASAVSPLPPLPPPPGAPGPAVKPVAVERPFDVETSGVEAEGQGSTHDPEGEEQAWDGPQDEPADFEWRNLKKLCVLVLSSLVWKNRKLQDQVRQFDGILTILSCCTFDEHNPYIREHAIMCLRFLMEGNAENQDIIRNLDAQEAVPKEVLDQHGYETFMDSKGQVGLRRKDGAPSNRLPAASQLVPAQPPLFPASSASLPEWMQMVMKAMPR